MDAQLHNFNSIKSIFLSLSVSFILMLLLPSVSLADPPDYSDSLKINKIFSLAEPWTLKQFNEKFSKMTCMKTCKEAVEIGLGDVRYRENSSKEMQEICHYGENLFVKDKNSVELQEQWINGDFIEDLQKKTKCIKAEDLEMVQGKTVKNNAGKAYFLTAAKMYSDYGYAVLGLRDLVSCEGECADSYEVQFYLLSTDSDFRTMLKQWGSIYRTYTHHEIVDVYADQDKGVTFIEFDLVFTGETNCGHPEMRDSKKCKKQQYESRVVRNVIMINSRFDYANAIEEIPRRAVISFSTIGNETGVSSTQEGSIKVAQKKIKGVKELKNITFPKVDSGNDLICTVEKDKKTKNYHLTCPHGNYWSAM